jgi:hypothetical protein
VAAPAGTQAALGSTQVDPSLSQVPKFTHITIEQGLSDQRVQAIVQDRTGFIWFGTNNGLNRYDGYNVVAYRHDPPNPHSLSGNFVEDLYEDRSGTLWVGTRSGLNAFDRRTERFTRYWHDPADPQSLSSDWVWAIAEDQRGRLWIGTLGGGLNCLEPATGQMSSTHGLIAFDPVAVRDDADVPPVVFTNFLLANKPVAIGETSPLRQAIDQADTIEPTYADRVVSFEFAPLSYRAPRQSCNRYKLEGFDDDWTEVGSTQRLVTYTNLDPARYVFRVTGANANGVWNEAGRAPALVVTPPWWAAWRFRGLALALIVGCMFSIYAWRVNSLKRQRRALEAEIVERKQAEEALRASQDSLQHSNAQIQGLAGRLLRAQEAERTRIARELHDDISQQLAALSIAFSGLRRRLPLEAAEARVLLKRTTAGLELTLPDDGQGFDLTKARRRGGLGLISLDERVRLVGGSVQITTQPQRGAELRVQVPLRGQTHAPRESAARR